MYNSIWYNNNNNINNNNNNNNVSLNNSHFRFHIWIRRDLSFLPEYLKAYSVCVCVCVCMYVCVYSLIGGPIELFLVPASAPRLVQQRPWYVLSCLWDDAYKRTLAANWKE